MKKSMQKVFGLTALLLVTAFLLGACGAAAPAEPTTDPSVIFTQVAETVMVSMTQTAQAIPPTATPEPTNTPAPTQPPVPTVDITAPTQSPAFVQQPVGPTATVQLFGDAAKWNTQSPVDGKVFKVGADFTFHVCMGNIGSSDWDGSYYLGYIDGYKACFDSRTYVGDVVEPGGKWCFDLPCKAPTTPGAYKTTWYLRDGDGNKIYGGEVYFAYKAES
jgi:hypothetical protein